MFTEHSKNQIHLLRNLLELIEKYTKKKPGNSGLFLWQFGE